MMLAHRTESNAPHHRPSQVRAGGLVAIALLACAALYLFVWWSPYAGTPVDPKADLCWLGQAAHPAVRMSAHPGTTNRSEGAGAVQSWPEEDAFLSPREAVLVDPAIGERRGPAGWVYARIVRPQDRDTGRWPVPAGGYVRTDELRAVAVSEILGMQTPRGRIETPLELPLPMRMGSVTAAQYGTEDAPVASLVCGSTYVLYQIQASGRPHWLFARTLADRLLMAPGVCAVTGRQTGGGPPDVLVFEPPLTLVCWRWQGSSLAPGPPGIGEYLLLVGLWASGCWWWLALAASMGLSYWACNAWIATGPAVAPGVLLSHVGLNLVLWIPYRFSPGLLAAILVGVGWALSAVMLREKTIPAVLVTAVACAALLFLGGLSGGLYEADWLMRP